MRPTASKPNFDAIDAIYPIPIQQRRRNGTATTCKMSAFTLMIIAESTLVSSA
jgi:hypothetical protein